MLLLFAVPIKKPYETMTTGEFPMKIPWNTAVDDETITKQEKYFGND